MITMHAFKKAVRRSLAAQARARTEEDKRIARKRLRQAEIEAAWRAELKRREDAARDEDGSRAAAREAAQEEQELERLASMAASIIRRQAKLS